jgi:hypothetical protein
MAKPRKKPDEPAKVEQTAEQPVAVAEQPEPVANGNGSHVVKRFTYPVSKDTWVEAQVHERPVVLRDNTTFLSHEVTTRKVWLNPHGEEKSLFTFRASELYALQHAIRRAEEFILDLRRVEESPF